MGMLKFDFTNETKDKIPKAPFKRLADKFYVVMKKRIDEKLLKRNGLIDLVIIDDAAIKSMNTEYRKKNSPTDVITFAYLEITDYAEEKGDVIAGDIFISVDTAKMQAKEKGHSLQKEMEILFVHGLLHSFGFDHKTDKEEAEMEKWAKKVLS